MKTHYWSYLINSRGEPVNGARIHVYVYPLGGGSATYASVYLTEGGSVTTTYDSILQTDANGYFEFWVADLEEGGSYGYEYQREFKITWSGAGISSGDVDKVQIFDVTKRSVDVTSSGVHYNRLISNALGKAWNEHITDELTDAHTQYLKTDGSRFLTGNWDTGGTYSILLNILRSRPGADLILTNYNGLGILVNATTGRVTIASPSTGLTVEGSVIVGALSVTGAATITGNLIVSGTFTPAIVDINAGTIDGTPIGASSPSTGSFSTLLATLATITTANITSLAVAGAGSIGTNLVVTQNLNVGGAVTITDGTINGVEIGQVLAGPGKFTTLSWDTLGGELVTNEADAFSATSLYSATFLKTGTLSVSGNSTLGNSLDDILTINGTVVTIPNDLNFDSGTFYIDSTNNRVMVGSTAGSRKLEVYDTNIQLRLRYDTGVYAEFAATSLGALYMTSSSLSAEAKCSITPWAHSTYNLGTQERGWDYLYFHRGYFWTSLQTSGSFFRGTDGWMTIGSSATAPTAPIDVITETIRIRGTHTPAASSPGYKGQICWDSGYIYVCTDTNTWKRAELVGAY